MTLALYLIHSIYKKRLVGSYEFTEWMYNSRGMVIFWIVFFSMLFGFFIAMLIATGEPIFLSVILCCVICVFQLAIELTKPIEPAVVEKVIETEKKIEVVKNVVIKPDYNRYGIIYIMRREDGILKFGKAMRLLDRYQAHKKDYQAHFEIVSSWVVPHVDNFERLALSLSEQYNYSEGNRRELRKMTDSELTNFILEFTNKVERGWRQ